MPFCGPPPPKHRIYKSSLTSHTLGNQHPPNQVHKPNTFLSFVQSIHLHTHTKKKQKKKNKQDLKRITKRSVSMQLSSNLTLFVAILAPVAVFAAPAEQHHHWPHSPYSTGYPSFSGPLPTGTGFPFPSGTGYPFPSGTGFHHHRHHEPKPTGTFTKYNKILPTPLN